MSRGMCIRAQVRRLLKVSHIMIWWLVGRVTYATVLTLAIPALTNNSTGSVYESLIFVCVYVVAELGPFFRVLSDFQCLLSPGDNQQQLLKDVDADAEPVIVSL